MKQTWMLVICLVFAACTDRGLGDQEGIALGVIRSRLNIPDTYVVNTNGSGEINISLPALYSTPEWSPDGKWIVSSTQYKVNRPEESEIYLLRADGNRRFLLVHTRGGGFDPTWAPDNSQIAYYAREGNQIGIYLLDVTCFQQGRKDCILTPTFLTPGDSAPDWSPDGRHIVYQYKGNIFVIGAKGDQQSPMNLTPNMSHCNNPKWSPDGARIAFSCYQPDRFDIFVMNADGTGLLNLTDGIGSTNVRPQWSPDGTKIAFVSNRGDLGQITGMDDTVRSNALFLMDSDGNKVVRLSLRDDEHVLWFAWIPR